MGSNYSKDVAVDKILEMIGPLQASAVIQSIGSSRSTEEIAEEDDTKTTDVQGMQEQFLKLTIPVKKLDGTDLGPIDKTHLIIAADVSGSMSGNPIKQVKIALEEIIDNTISNPNMQTDLITFQSTAKLIEMDRTNYKERINSLMSGGGTSFSAAFKATEDQIRNQRDTSVTKTVIVFLTDGQDSSLYNCRSFSKLVNTLCSGIDALKKPYTVHTVGFSRDHAFNFLNELSQSGKGDGMYRYCEPQDGPMVLREKLQELFDFILVSSASNADIEMEMNDDNNKFIVSGKMLKSCTVPGDVTEETKNDDINITTECWLYLADPTCVPSFSVTLTKQINKGKEAEVVSIPCEVVQIQQVVLESAREKILWNLMILTRNADVLASKIGTAIAEKKDAVQFGSRIDKLQQRLSKTPLFKKELIDDDTREIMRRYLDEIQGKISSMRSLLADYAREDSQSVQILARANDMRYQAKFSKSRRQRIMDKRVATNINIVKDAQMQLNMLEISKEEVDKISQNSAEFYFCALSQDSVKDILLSKDRENAIGFGLAVKRMEHVLDEPSVLKISNISGTLVSRTSMLDALEYKINCDGQLSAHGGFDFYKPLGVTTVGMGREPINAWLPLYCNKHHWDRVKVLLKPTLGYFCTLDPLGFDYKQLDVMFMVLGSMIGQLSEQRTGEHQIRLILAFQRTCQALMDSNNLTADCVKILKNFRDTPEKRTRDVIPNLFTLIGYVASLPPDKAKDAIGTEADSVKLSLRKFWLAYISETIRRSANRKLKDTSMNIITGLIELLVSANKKDNMPVLSLAEAEVKLSQLCGDKKLYQAPMPLASFDPRADIDVPTEIEVKYNEKIDKAMEIFAQAQCGVISNKNQAAKVAAAKKAVTKWKEEGLNALNTSVTTETDETVDPNTKNSATSDAETSANLAAPDNVGKVSLSVVENLVKILQNISKVSYPSFGSMPGCIAFIEQYLTNEPQCSEMDDNDGLPPEEWIVQVKSAVSTVYSCMNAYQQRMYTESNAGSTCCAKSNKTRDHQNEDNTLVCDTDLLLSTNQNDTASDGVTLSTNQNDTVSDGVTPSTNQNDAVSDSNVSSSVTPQLTNKDSDEDDDDNDESDNEEDDDDYYDEDNYTRTAKLPKERAGHRTENLPPILHIVAPDINIFQMLRVFLSQAIQIHSNSKARSAMKGDNFTDLSCDVDYDAEVCKLLQDLQQMRESAIQDAKNSLLWQRANQSMLKAKSVWAFVGYMMNTYPDRNQGFSDLITMVLEVENVDQIPELKEKVRVIFLGKYQEHSIVAKGNVWIPESKISKKFAELLGEDVWTEIEMDVRSKVQLHVYRESDIPNRHGHCNSNPYIPNYLRKKLGMPLLKNN